MSVGFSAGRQTEMPIQTGDRDRESEREMKRGGWREGGNRETELAALAAAFCMIAACNASHTNYPQCCPPLACLCLCPLPLHAPLLVSTLLLLHCLLFSCILMCVDCESRDLCGRFRSSKPQQALPYPLPPFSTPCLAAQAVSSCHCPSSQHSTLLSSPPSPSLSLVRWLIYSARN